MSREPGIIVYRYWVNCKNSQQPMSIRLPDLTITGTEFRYTWVAIKTNLN